MHAHRAVALSSVHDGATLGIDAAGGTVVGARVHAVLIDARSFRHTLRILGAVRFEALLFWVAVPARRAVAHRAVLLRAAQSVDATRGLDEARVGAHLLDAGAVRWTVSVNDTQRFGSGNKVAVHVGVADVPWRTGALGLPFNHLALGLRRTGLEHGAEVEALAVAAHLAAPAVVI